MLSSLFLPFSIYIFKLHLQKFHLISQNPAVSEYQVFCQVGDVGYGEEWHARFFRRVAALTGVTAFTGRDYITPMVAPTAGDGFDMVAGQETVAEFMPAIQACMHVTAKQFAVG